MNLANEPAVRQLPVARQQAIDEIERDQPPSWPHYAARPFDDLRCPICGSFGCEGC